MEEEYGVVGAFIGGEGVIGGVVAAKYLASLVKTKRKESTHNADEIGVTRSPMAKLKAGEVLAAQSCVCEVSLLQDPRSVEIGDILLAGPDKIQFLLQRTSR